MSAPCSSDPKLFESEALDAHLVARETCETCPIRAYCRAELDRALAASVGITDGHPRGTWAGLLIKNRRVVRVKDTSSRDANRARIAAEEAAYTDEQAKRAHVLYDSGDRSPWVMAGNRTYKRRWARKHKAAA